MEQPHGSPATVTPAASVSEGQKDEFKWLFETHGSPAVLIAVDYYCKDWWGGPNAHYCTDPLYRLHCRIDYTPSVCNRNGVDDEDENVRDAFEEIGGCMSTGGGDWTVDDLGALVDAAQANMREVYGE